MRMSRRHLMTTTIGAVAIALGSRSTGVSAQANNPEMKSVNLECGNYSKDITHFIQASDMTLSWLMNQIQPDGQYPEPIVDLTGYFKVAYLFTITGRLEQANRLVSEIGDRFLQANGDFKVSPTRKSDQVDYYEKVWGYANAWIVFIAHKLGRFEISYPAWNYLEKMYLPEIGGYISNDPDSNDEPVIDLLATTHSGHAALYMGNLERARQCANLVMTFLTTQPDIQTGCFFRMNKQGRFIKDYAEEDAGYFYLDSTKREQFYFMAGYPIAFLSLLYRKTGDAKYLEFASLYFDFASQCTGIFESHFSHKVAWGASILYNLTGDTRYADFAVKVGNYLVEIQHESGAWFHDTPPRIAYDQSAECASWLRQICAEICDRRT